MDGWKHCNNVTKINMYFSFLPVTIMYENWKTHWNTQRDHHLIGAWQNIQTVIKVFIHQHAVLHSGSTLKCADTLYNTITYQRDVHTWLGATTKKKGEVIRLSISATAIYFKRCREKMFFPITSKRWILHTLKQCKYFIFSIQFVLEIPSNPFYIVNTIVRKTKWMKHSGLVIL